MTFPICSIMEASFHSAALCSRMSTLSSSAKERGTAPCFLLNCCSIMVFLWESGRAGGGRMLEIGSRMGLP